MARALSLLWAEVDEARLVGVEGQSISSEALAQDRQHAFGVIDIIERHQRVVSEPDKDALTGSPEAVACLRFPQNVACGFPAPRSSAVASQLSLLFAQVSFPWSADLLIE